MNTDYYDNFTDFNQNQNQDSFDFANAGGYDPAYDNQNNDPISNEARNQYMHDQQDLKDRQIDQLGVVTKNLKTLAQGLDSDINEQGQLLDQVGMNTVDVNDHVIDTTRKTEKLD